jgi:hypothetical protein
MRLTPWAKILRPQQGWGSTWFSRRDLFNELMSQDTRWLPLWFT